MRGPLVLGDVQGRPHELRDLALPADERGFVAEAEGARVSRPQRDELVCGDRLPLAFQSQWRQRPPGGERHRGDCGVAPGEDRPDSGGVRQPRCRVDRVADDRVGEGGLHAREHLARVEPHAKPEPSPAAELVSDELTDLLLHHHGRADGAFCIVLVGGRGTEHGHDPVAGELVDVAADVDDDPGEGGQHAIGDLPDPLGIEVFRPSGEVRQITEEHGDDAALGRLVDAFGRQRHPADMAEAGVGDGRGRAGRTAQRSGRRRWRKRRDGHDQPGDLLGTAGSPRGACTRIASAIWAARSFSGVGVRSSCPASDGLWATR